MVVAARAPLTHGFRDFLDVIKLCGSMGSATRPCRSIVAHCLYVAKVALRRNVTDWSEVSIPPIGVTGQFR